MARTTAHSAEEGERGLRRRVGPVGLALYGAGTILGAGIYVLIGEIAAEAGYWAPVAFVVAAVVAGVNGMAYAELATRVPSAGGPSAYVERAFHRRWASGVIGWMIVATGVVSAATIARGFAGYLAVFTDVPEWAGRAGLILLLGAVAASGVRLSVWFMAATTTCGIAGIAIVVWAGLASDPSDPRRPLEAAAPLGEPEVLTGLLAAVFLAVYAFIGFEDIVHLAEEVKRPAFSIPFAIGVALALCAVLYTLTAFAALSVLAPEELGGAPAPLVDVVAAAGGPTWPVAMLSVIVISSGVLAQLVMASRTILSLGREGGGVVRAARAAPALLASVSPRTGTPIAATVLCTVIALALALLVPLATLASATSLIMLLVFATSNVALIILERRRGEAAFDTPVWLPWIGAALSIGLVGAWAIVG